MATKILPATLLPTAEELNEVLDYNPETGTLTWKNLRVKNQRKNGEEVGWITEWGYRKFELNGKGLLSHRVIWFLMTGKWPACEIDHINGDPADNRWCNLREATRKQNARNISGNKNRTLPKGAYRNGKKWSSAILVDGNQLYLGYFETPEEAHEAYCAAARKHYGEFARFD